MTTKGLKRELLDAGSFNRKVTITLHGEGTAKRLEMRVNPFTGATHYEVTDGKKALYKSGFLALAVNHYNSLP